jgi:endonuclease YncB( thermonuclease family)
VPPRRRCFRGSLFRLVFLLIFIVAAWAPAWPQDRPHSAWTIQCIQTRGFADGDTFTCASADTAAETFVVRFAGIDAPERGQAYWRAARSMLRELAGPGVQVACYKTDRFRRELCRLSRDGVDLADSMLSAGLAWHSTRFAAEQTVGERERYAQLEADARELRIGLWGEDAPMPPWECRRAKERGARCR